MILCFYGTIPNSASFTSEETEAAERSNNIPGLWRESGTGSSGIFKYCQWHKVSHFWELHFWRGPSLESTKNHQRRVDGQGTFKNITLKSKAEEHCDYKSWQSTQLWGSEPVDSFWKLLCKASREMNNPLWPKSSFEHYLSFQKYQDHASRVLWEKNASVKQSSWSLTKALCWGSLTCFVPFSFIAKLI